MASALSPWFTLLVGVRFLSGVSLGLIAWIAWAEAFGDDEKVGDVAVIGPLVERYGAVAVIVRAQLIALATITPSGYLALDDSTFLWKSFIAVAILGIFGTGIARSLQAALISRAGAPRASIVGYLVPVVAAILGVVVLDEVLSAIELAGLVVISVGAFLGSRQIKPLD